MANTSTMPTARGHIEEIRMCKFAVGASANPLTEDLHRAVKHLSAELYTKDVHFLMELIQNAEDNEYPPGVKPSLEFVFTKRDITGVGAQATLLIFNNENGFSKDNIESLCSVGRSTKKGKRQGGYIGEKVTRQPYLFSNGYCIRFNELPSRDVRIGYIVPEWVNKPTVLELHQAYGCTATLPNTTIVLPLRPEKVAAVKEELSNIYPEVILFLSKIKKLSVRRDGENPLCSSINAISVSLEIDFQHNEEADSESFSLHLSAEEEKGPRKQCSYYMWRQRFPVNLEGRIDERKDIDKWVVTLAFPFDERLTRGMPRADVYAFLPTEMITRFPFIVNADFLLASSRESIIWDNKWNKEILKAIPSAFCGAFVSRLRAKALSKPLSIAQLFGYIPIHKPSYPQLQQVRDSIKMKLMNESIVLCEPYKSTENAFHKPIVARRVLPGFREIMRRAKEQGLQNPNVQCPIVHSCLEEDQYLKAMEFLVIGFVSNEWYARCIETPGWVLGLSENLYLDLLCFLAEHWENRLSNALRYVPVFKFINSNNVADLMSLSDSYRGPRIYFSYKIDHISWLTKWTGELGCATKYCFMPEATQIVMQRVDLPWQRRQLLRGWLSRYPKITELSVSSFSEQLLEDVKNSRNSKLVVCITQFLHYSLANRYITTGELERLCSSMPVADNFGTMGFVELSEDYLKSPPCAADISNDGDLVCFLKTTLGAFDIPMLTPPNGALPAASNPLSKANAFRLLNWISYLTKFKPLPENFKRSIAEGRWVKTHCVYESPSRSFLFDSKWESVLQLSDVPFIDNVFYGEVICTFKGALGLLGVVVELGQGCNLIAEHLKMHTELQAISRLYKYLHQFKWSPCDSSTVEIWIPGDDGNVPGAWKDVDSCVIHDDNGYFHSRLNILEKYYEAALIPFFSNLLGVPLYPIIEDYCNLWLDWISEEHQVTEDDCCLVWGNILNHWANSSAAILNYLRVEDLRLPVFASNEKIEIADPKEAFVPDNFQLASLFNTPLRRPKFTWSPNTCVPDIHVDLLNTIYNHLGVQNLSQSVQKFEMPIPDSIYLWKLNFGEGLVGIGLYRLILGYLAKPSFKLSVDKRHEIVNNLLESSTYEAIDPFTVEYSLLLQFDGKLDNIRVQTTTAVRWEKDYKRILMIKFDKTDQKEKILFATDFAHEISNGLISEYPDLIAGLCEMLKFGCVLGFHIDAVNHLLQTKNLQLYMEDEHYLSSIFTGKAIEIFNETKEPACNNQNLSTRKRVSSQDVTDTLSSSKLTEDQTFKNAENRPR
eukprot:Gb_15824 [translate_table: standard]